MRTDVLIRTVLACLTCLAVPVAAADPVDVESVGELTSSERVYAVPKPVGPVRVSFTAGDGKAAPPTLTIACDLFRAAVPAAALADLPRPQWGEARLVYSMTSYDPATKATVDRPYVYVAVPVHGPPDRRWQDTVVTFHVDDKGRFERRIKRLLRDPRVNVIRLVWEPWPVGRDVDPDQLLNAAAGR
jgi:hypothetical protein